MIGNSVLLDTSIVINLFKGDQSILSFLEEQKNIYVPSIVLGELFLGAHRSKKPSKHLDQIRDFLTGCAILQIDSVTAEHYGSIKHGLLLKGHPIPENDIWIAATALQHNLPVFTNDKHFDVVESLLLVRGQQ